MPNILIADNNIHTVNIRSDALKHKGYHVFPAYNPIEARKVLNEELIHLAILDIRLTDDKDGDDSGLKLAEDEEYAYYPKIVMTGYPSVESALRALKKHRSLNYVKKKDGVEVMLQAVEEALKDLQINWDLEIDWRGLNFSLLNAIYPGLEGETLLSRSQEFDDLLRRFFYNRDQVRVGRLLWQRQGRVAFTALARQGHEQPEGIILVCSSRQQGRAEAEVFQRNAPRVPGSNGTAFVGYHETFRFAANGYALAGADLETTQSLLASFRLAPVARIRDTLTTLVGATLGVWHQARHLSASDEESFDALFAQRLGLQTPQGQDEFEFRSQFAARLKTLAERASALGARLEMDDESLSIHFPQQSFTYPNPAAALFNSLDKPISAMLSRSPGRLGGENILTSEQGGCWLTDFAQAGQAPLFWDYTDLEAAMRFDWVEAVELQRLHDIETCLLGERFSRPDVNLVEKDLRKPVQAIQSLRQCVNAAVGRDEELYHRGLLYHAASRLMAYDPAALLTNRELASLAHALLAVAMLGKKISIQAGAVPSTRGDLQLDKSRHTATVAGRVVELQGDGYKILSYLFDHHDTVCLRSDILLAVYEVTAPNADDDRRLNTALRRLRDKIEPDSSNPIFLITHPGQGYELKKRAL